LLLPRQTIVHFHAYLPNEKLGYFFQKALDKVLMEIVSSENLRILICASEEPSAVLRPAA